MVEEGGVRTASILRAELNIRANRVGVRDHLSDTVENLLGRHAKLVLHVNGGGGEEDMNTGVGGHTNTLPRLVDISLRGASQGTNAG